MLRIKGLAKRLPPGDLALQESTSTCSMAR